MQLSTRAELTSGDVWLIHRSACASIGMASNVNHKHRQLDKAGRSRLLGMRPTVRNFAMNAADQSHGGERGMLRGSVHRMESTGIRQSLERRGYDSRPV